VTLTDRDEARFTFASLYLSRRFGVPDPDETVAHLVDLQKRVRARLAEGYRGNHLPPPTGYPGPKTKDALLYLLVRSTRPRLVLETGVDQGVSSTFLLEAMRENGVGTLLSIDIGTTTESQQPVGWLVPPELRARWDLRIGPAERLLPQIGERPDIFLHDSLHTYDHMTMEFAWADAHLAPGGLLLSDDIDCNASYTDFLQRGGSRWRSLSDATVGVAQRLTA
jgi:Methyltransferase domain